ncbi:conserved membrane hypothetical protein [metagenome]|uniref:Fenitrothion hydrolase n=1 Tax=metagenome TaxID=256318 RepID=A0A2P2C2W5_9ZZZZ
MIAGRDRLLAHGIGGAKDLPISPELAIAGAVAALTVSFTVLALAWRQPRFAASRSRRAPRWLAAAVDSTAFGVAARVFGFAVFAWALMAAVFGKDVAINPFLGMFYVLLWVAIVPLSLLLGPFYRAVSPVRTINLVFAKLSGGSPEEGLYRYPERWGYWPAAFGLFAFVWMELVYTSSTALGPVRLWFVLYVGAMLIGGALFGNRFYERADPFEVYSTLVAHLSPWSRDDAGALVLRTPMANLARVPALPGLVAVVSVLFGSTAFDSFKDSNVWLQHIQSSSVSPFLQNNLMLVGFCLLVGVLFSVATASTGVGPDQRRSRLPSLFAHSMVPIVVGYIAAHYLTYLIEVGQGTVIQMSDPFSRGDNLLGTGDWAINYWLSNQPSLLASTKVVAVVTGHVLGVVAAHDRAIELLPRRHQLTGQLPLLIVMVCFTVSGLYLLFAA